MFKEINCDEGKKLYEQNKDNYVWLDVRTLEEFNQGHIPGCKHIPIDEIENRLSEVGPKDANYVVYCAVGGRSSAVCNFLQSKGYTSLINLDGGMNEWQGPKNLG